MWCSWVRIEGDRRLARRRDHADLSLDDLDQFHDGDRSQGAGGDQCPVRGAERNGVQHPLQQRDVHGRGLQEQTDQHGPPEPAVREHAGRKHRMRLGTRVERVRDLGQGERHERDRDGVAEALALRPVPAHTDEERQEGDARQQQALPDDQADEAAGHERQAWVARRCLHDIRSRRFDRECHGREHVRDHVEPQDLQRPQWQRPAEHDRGKDGENLRKVAREQVVDEAEDVATG